MMFWQCGLINVRYVNAKILGRTSVISYPQTPKKSISVSAPEPHSTAYSKISSGDPIPPYIYGLESEKSIQYRFPNLYIASELMLHYDGRGRIA